MSVQNDSFPALSGVFPASDGLGSAPAVTKNISVKRALDVLLSLAAFFVFLPILAVILVAVVLDSPGPAFFRQRRVGQYGKIFNIYKFRSMHVLEDGAQVVQACEGDARITRLGKFLRITSLDELPQLLNVLAGDMSLVGPRPERPEFIEELAKQLPLYHERHAVKAGLTGWAQVNYPYGASLDDARSKLSYDLYYVKNFNLLLDFKIMLQTLRVVVWAGADAR